MIGPLLQCDNVAKHYGEVRAVDGVTLGVERGQILALLGPSGCGKTTLLRLLAGFERLDSGRITLGGKVLATESMSLAPEKRRVGLVFQDYALFHHMSVEANVRFGLPRGGDRRRAAGILEVVGLGGLGKRMPHEISGGQQQRVALARTLAAEPELVLLDEPFSNLDPGLREQVREEVWSILDSFGATAIIVTHDQEEALSLPGDIAVMMRGKLMQVGTPAEVYERPATREVAEFVGDVNVILATANGTRATCELGPVTLASEVYGEAEIVVRPEDIALGEDGPVTASVVRREYFGHDQLVTLRLASGTTVRARTGHGFDLAPGQTCGIRISGTALAFAG